MAKGKGQLLQSVGLEVVLIEKLGSDETRQLDAEIRSTYHVVVRRTRSTKKTAVRLEVEIWEVLISSYRRTISHCTHRTRGDG